MRRIKGRRRRSRTTEVLYFAYGSNLSEEQMRERCPGAAVVGEGELRGYRLAFGGYSGRWGGGVATVVRDRRASVPGLLYRMGAGDLERLDGYEGHPVVYCRERVEVRRRDGGMVSAWTYFMREQKSLWGRLFGDRDAAPSGRYLGIIRDAYRAHGWAWGLGKRKRQMGTTDVFVYGTLMAGEGNHRLLEREEFVGEAETEVGFTMLDLGSFPGVVRAGEGRVVGEVYRVGPETLARLDRLEGHPHFYRRERIKLDDGRLVEGYILQDGWRNRKIIAGGSWRDRNGVEEWVSPWDIEEGN